MYNKNTHFYGSKETLVLRYLGCVYFRNQGFVLEVLVLSEEIMKCATSHTIVNTNTCTTSTS